MLSRCLLYLYQIVERLLPGPFRREFGEEMRSAFLDALSDPANSGLIQKLALAAGELAGLLREAAAQHRFLIWQKFTLSDETPLKAKISASFEMIAVLAVFSLPMAAAVAIQLPIFWQQIAKYSAGGIFLFLCLAGIVHGFPRWSLPSLGLALSSLVFLFLYQGLPDQLPDGLWIQPFFEIRRSEMVVLLDIFWAGMMWLCLFSLLGVFFMILAVLKRLDTLVERIRLDWTQVSYMLYSGAVVVFLLVLKENPSEAALVVLAALFLALGALAYLRQAGQTRRIAALFTGLFFAVGVVSAGDWSGKLMYLSGDLQGYIASPSVVIPRLVLTWGWVVSFLLVPAALRLARSARRTWRAYQL
jgi:hypothetical protein